MQPPGNVAMGQYAMTATESEVDFLFDANGPFPMLADGGPIFPVCELVEVTGDEFTFNAVLTHDRDSSAAWVTLNGYSREGTFDGQVLTSTAEANRVFAACPKCTNRVVETISVAVLSRSQSDALGPLCPDNALDGGIVVNPDAGIVLPGLTREGYDGVRVCGELTTEVIALGGECEAKCAGCFVRYPLRGDRR